mgnify:CR=1 FL=1
MTRANNQALIDKCVANGGRVGGEIGGGGVISSITTPKNLKKGDTFTVTVRPPRKPAHVWGEKNTTEKLYYDLYLAPKLYDKQLSSYERVEFETDPIILPAERCKYYIDFTCWRNDGLIEYHEVKGGYQDKKTGRWKSTEHDAESRVKFKWASTLHPGRLFFWAKLQKGGTFKIEVWKAGKKISGGNSL